MLVDSIKDNPAIFSLIIYVAKVLKFALIYQVTLRIFFKK